MQGNALMALAALVQVSTAYEADLQKSTKKPSSFNTSDNGGFLRTSHWAGMAYDTILTIADEKYKSTGRLLSWCQYRSVSNTGKLTTSQIGKICALCCLPSVLMSLMSLDTGRVSKFMMYLKRAICDEGLPNNISFTIKVSTGRVLARFLDKHVTDETVTEYAQECSETILSCLDSFSKKSLDSDSDSDSDSSDDDDDQDSLGSILASGFLVSSQFKSGKPQTRTSARESLAKVMKQLSSNTDLDQSQAKALCFVLVKIVINGSQSDSFDKTLIPEVFEIVRKQYNENKTNTEFCEWFGSLCYFLKSSYEPAANSFEELSAKWEEMLKADRMATRQRLSALSGFCSINGSQSVFYGIPSTQEKVKAMDSCISLLKQFIQKSHEVGVSSGSILSVSRFYLACENVGQSSRGLPDSFFYLPTTSVLKPAFDHLLKHCGSITSSAILRTVADLSATCVFPPVDWRPVFQSIDEMGAMDRYACYKIALHQCFDNISCADFLSKCISPTFLNEMDYESKLLMFSSMKAWFKHCPKHTLIPAVEYVIQLIEETQNRGVLQAVLQGVLAVYKSFDLTQWALETADNLLLGIFSSIRIGESLRASDLQHIANLASCFAKSNSDVDTLVVTLRTSCSEMDGDCRKFLLLAINLLHLSKNPWNTCFFSLHQCYNEGQSEAALCILATSLGKT